MLTQLDRKIIKVISQELPLEERPFKALAFKLGIEEEWLLERIKVYKKNAILRKYAAVLNHIRIGFRHNAMAVWKIPAKSIKKTGGIMATFSMVSHCYQRKKVEGWDYNLYTMLHGRTKQECFMIIEEISRRTGCKDYKVLFSTKEYKKTPVKY